MRDLNKFYSIDLYGKSSKKPYNRGKSFGYQILGFGSGVTGSSFLPYQKGIFAFGTSNKSNLLGNTGVVAADTTLVGTARFGSEGTGIGGDFGIIGYGSQDAADPSVLLSLSNLVSNLGVIQSDQGSVGTARKGLGAATYGGQYGIFLYGEIPGDGRASKRNLVGNTGVVAADATAAGTARGIGSCTSYSAENDKAFHVFGNTSSGDSNLSNLISNIGVVSADVTGVGTARNGPRAGTYGDDKAVVCFGGAGPSLLNTRNLISNVGVVATDTSGAGTARYNLGCAPFGGDKCCFAYGVAGGNVSMSNLVSNTGVIAADTSGVGTAGSTMGTSGFGN